jgi:hypothetical protein
MAVQAPNYLPQVLQDAWLAAYIDAGGAVAPEAAAAAALAAIREHPQYDTFFPGNRREDGTFRFSESGYYQERLDFENTLASYGIDPNVIDGQQYGELIGNDVTAEEFGFRVDQAYTLATDYGPAMIQWYEQNYGLRGLTIEDITATFLDPTLDEAIIQRNVRSSIVGGRGSEFGFEVSQAMAEQMLQRGLTPEESGQFFGDAANRIPVLDVLARRHSDPDDDFDLNEFTAATLYADPTERRRMARLMNQERSLFANGGGLIRDGQRITGLTSR